MKSVVALSRSVNTTTDAASEAMTTIARLEMRRSSPSEAPIITGSSGRMQGARIVSMPARTEIPKNSILIDLPDQARE